MQNVARAALAREGLMEPIEEALIQALELDPAAKISNLESIVAAYASVRAALRD